MRWWCYDNDNDVGTFNDDDDDNDSDNGVIWMLKIKCK